MTFAEERRRQASGNKNNDVPKALHEVLVATSNKHSKQSHNKNSRKRPKGLRVDRRNILPVIVRSKISRTVHSVMLNKVEHIK